MDPNHRVRWLDEFVDGLDLSALEDCYRGSGSQAYRPDLMLKIALLLTLQGERSPAKWRRAVEENIAVQWLGRGIRPSRTALYDFRDRLAEPIADICAFAVREAQAEKLLDPVDGVLDGTFVRAQATRHRLVNLSTLKRRRAELQAVREKDVADEAVSEVPVWMAQTRDGRKEQAEKYARAQQELERRVAENAKRPKSRSIEEKNVFIATSDPEAALGRDKEKVYCPLYAVQYMVEPQSLIILSFDVFAQNTDANTLAPMLDNTEQVIGCHLETVTADAGYVSVLDLEDCAARKVELFGPVHENNYTEKKRASQPAGKSKKNLERALFHWDAEQQIYICPQGHAMKYETQERKARSGGREVLEFRYRCPGAHCQTCPRAHECTSNPHRGRTIKRLEKQELLDAHRQKMETPEAKAKMRRRGEVVERSFADAKAHRALRRFHGRGLKRARAETGLVVLAQNALTINRLRQERANPSDF